MSNSSTSTPDRGYEGRRLAERIGGALDALTPVHREAFVLREMRGKSYEEIAAITHANLGTVKSRLCRARQTLAETLADEAA